MGSNLLEEISCLKSFQKYAKTWDGIEGRKTEHLETTALYCQDFSDQLIKERTGHCSLEVLYKYKRIGNTIKVSMAPQIEGKENKKPLLSSMLSQNRRFLKVMIEYP